MADNFITEVDLCDEAKDNFLTYSSEVLTDRSIPSAEDGLLSAQRKLLWTMEDYLKMDSKSKTKKCQALVGSTLATSYFHGDASCYGVLCKMSQAYLMRYPLITGQGSLGTQESNDMVASSRYTEAKPSIYADLMMRDFKKNVVPLKETYNSEFMEPVVLPGLFPNALCNGRQTIGVSMAHSMPCHNLTEVCNAAIRYLRQGDITIDEIIEEMPAPDFPLPSTIINKSEIRKAYSTGKTSTSLKVRGEYEIHDNKIIFTTIPYRTYRNKIREQIEKNVDVFDELIDDFVDESSIGQNRLVFSIKPKVSTDKVLNKLFALTDLQTTVSYNMNFIVNGTPKLLNMKQLLKAYIDHQENVLIKATEFDKQKAEERAHILEGLVAAVDKIDEVIALIKRSDNRAAARAALISFLAIDEIQANAILDMKLGKLTRIDKTELINELREKHNIIAKCIELLTQKDKRTAQLITTITWLRDTYGDARRTKLVDIEDTSKAKEVVELVPEDVAVVVTENHLIKRIPKAAFKTARRNTTGVKNAGQITAFSCFTTTADTLMIFTSTGKMYRIKVADIPEGNNVSQGVSLLELAKLENKETPMAYATFTENNPYKYIIFTTKKGITKKVLFSDFLSTKRSGITAINFKDGDSLVAVDFVNDEEIVIITRRGFTLRVPSTSFGVSSRTAQGVKGIALKENDYVVAMRPLRATDTELLYISSSGLGKRTLLTEYDTQTRASRGLVGYSGEVQTAFAVNDKDHILISGDKSSIALDVKELPLIGRNSQGNILLKTNTVVSASKF